MWYQVSPFECFVSFRLKTEKTINWREIWRNRIDRHLGGVISTTWWTHFVFLFDFFMYGRRRQDVGIARLAWTSRPLLLPDCWVDSHVDGFPRKHPLLLVFARLAFLGCLMLPFPLEPLDVRRSTFPMATKKREMQNQIFSSFSS